MFAYILHSTVCKTLHHLKKALIRQMLLAHITIPPGIASVALIGKDLLGFQVTQEVNS